MRSWLRAAGERSVLRRAVVSAVVVGVLLTLVNHGPQLAHGEASAGLIAQVALTVMVPFLVSCASSVAAVRELERRRR
jgi:hypothetical protein